MLALKNNSKEGQMGFRDLFCRLELCWRCECEWCQAAAGFDAAGLKYLVLEKSNAVGGVWRTFANQSSRVHSLINWALIR